MEHLPRKAKEPRVHFIPYRSNSKQWAMFVVTWIEKEHYTLRAIVPKDFDEAAFAWAINHLTYQFKIKDEPSYTYWHSETGAQLLVADGLLQALSSDMSASSRDDRERFVTNALATLRGVRDAAVQAWNSNVEEVLSENASLATEVENMFAPILRAELQRPRPTPWSSAESKRRAPSPKVKRKRGAPPSQRSQGDDQWSDRNSWSAVNWSESTNLGRMAKLVGSDRVRLESLE